MNLSKKYKLPKYMWRPGKSKFLMRRAAQEGLLPLVWTGYAPHDSILSQLHRRLITETTLTTAI